MFAAFDHPGFRRYYYGQGISLIGTWLQAAAVRWVVYDQTRSEFLLGVVEVASLLPGVFVGLFAGALADRVSPLRMMVVMELAQMVLAFVLAFLVGAGVVAIWQLILILALARISVTFELPSRQIFFYELVGAETLPNAIALNSGLFNATRVIGPALSGPGLMFLGASGCFAINGASYIAAILVLLSIRVDRTPHLRPSAGFRFSEMLGGLLHLRKDRRMLALFVMVALFGVVAMGYEAMVPAYARTVIHTDVEGYSLLLAFSGVGATLGAFAVAWHGGARRKERVAIVGLIVFAASIACGALLPIWLPASWHQWTRLSLGSLCMLGAGFGAALFYASAQTLVQLASPDRLRGRIMGIWMIVYSGSVPLGALWTGRAAQSFGIAPVMGFSAVLCLVVAAIVAYTGALASDRTPQPQATEE
jgi:MFS family permease